jgi:hypothetical protein
MKVPAGIRCFGDLTYRGKCNTEDACQKAFFGWLKERRPSLYAIAIHPKNEGIRGFYAIKKERELGSLNKGASDIIIPCRIPFVCELKRKDRTKSSISQEQIDYLKNCELAGAFACVAFGYMSAIEALIEWEKLNNPLLSTNV